MARFDVYRQRGESNLLLDCQADALFFLVRRFVVPLFRELEIDTRIRRLHPVFLIEGEQWIMATHLAASVHKSELSKRITSLSGEYDRITSALDMLLTGF